MTQVLYAARAQSLATSDLYTVDPATGAMTSVGPIGFAVSGLAFDPTNDVLYGSTSTNSGASPQSLITINPLTGAGTLVGALGVGNAAADICFDAAGQLYGLFPTLRQFGTIDKATGATSLFAASGPTPQSGGAVSVDSGGTVWAVPRGMNNNLWTIDPATGVFTDQGALGGALSGDAAAGSFDAADLLWVAISPGGGSVDLGTVDTSTRLATDIGAMTIRTDALAWGPDAGVLTAAFTGTPLSGPVPLTVAFTDTSTGGPASWVWDFGDGGSSSLQNPTHVYTVPGTYDVTLTVA